MAQIFLVEGRTGEYDDRCEWPVCAYKSKKDAEAHMFAANNRALAYKRTASGLCPPTVSFHDHMGKLDPVGMFDSYTGTSYCYYPIEVFDSFARGVEGGTMTHSFRDCPDIDTEIATLRARLAEVERERADAILRAALAEQRAEAAEAALTRCREALAECISREYYEGQMDCARAALAAWKEGSRDLTAPTLTTQ